MGNEQSAVLGLGTKIEAGTKQAFATIADGFRSIAKGMSDSASELRKVGQAAPAKIFEDAAKGINKLTEGLDKQISKTKVLSATQVDAANALKKSQSEAASSQKKTTAELSKANDELVETTAVSKKAATQLGILKDKFHDILNASGSKGRAANNLWASFTTPGKDQSGNITPPKINDDGAAKRLEIQLQRLQQSFTAVTATAKNSATSFQNLYKKFPDLKEHIRTLQKTKLSYEEQIAVLTRLKNTRKEEEKTYLSSNKRVEDIDRLKVSYSGLLAESSRYQKMAMSEIASLNNMNTSVRAVTTSLMAMKQAQAQDTVGNKNTEARALAIEKLKFKYVDLAAAEGKYGDKARALLSTTAKQTTNLSALGLALAKVAKEQNDFDSSGKSMGKRSTEIAKLKLDYEGLLSATNKYGAEARQLVGTLGSLGVEVDLVKAKLANLAPKSNALTNQLDGIQKLRKSYADLRLSTDRYGLAANKIIGNIQSHNIEISKAGAALGRLQAQQKAAASGFTSIGGAINLVIGKLRSYAGYMVASSAVFAFISGIRSATEAIATYDQSLKDLQAITAPTQAELSAMADTMKKVASDTKFSAAETAEGMKLLGQAGLEADEVISAIPAVTNLAIGTMADLSSVVDLTSTALRAFGLEAKDMGYITDVFANAVNRSKLTIEDIRTALNYVGPAAHNAGMSLDETARVMMVLRDNGLKASTMATAFRRVLAKLEIPTESFKKGIEDAGLKLEDFDVKGKGISVVLHNLGKVVKTNKDAFEDFGIYGSAAVTALVKDADKFDDLADGINREGSAAEMAAIQMQGLTNMFKNLQAKIGNLWIAIGEGGFTGVLKGLVNVARFLVDVLTDLANSKVVQFIVKVWLAVTAVKALTAAIMLLKNSSIITAVVGSMSTALSSLAGVMGGVTTAAGLASAAMTLFNATVLKFGPAAALAVFGAIIYEISNYSQKLKDVGIELGVQTDRVEDSISSLKSLETSMADLGGEQGVNAGLVAKLSKEYADFADELKAASGSGEEFAKVLAKIRAEEEKKKKKVLKDKLENIGEQYTDNAEGATTYSMSLRRLLHDEKKEAEITNEIKDKNKSLSDQYVKTGKALGMSNSEILDSLNEALSKGFIFRWDRAEMVSQAEAALKLLEKPAIDSGRKIGEQTALGIKEALEEGMGEQELVTKADVFDKSSEVKKFKEDNQAIEKDLAQHLYAISVAEAQGTKTHEEAEIEKLNVTLDSYDKMVAAAKLYHEAAAKSGTSTQEKEAIAKVDAAIEQSNQVRLQKLQAYATQREAINQKITEQNDKLAGAEEAHDNKVLDQKKDKADKIQELEASTNLKITEITEAAVQKRLDAEKDFEDKKKEFVQKRIDIEREAAADIAGLQSSLEDKITNIRMKGLSESQKQTAIAEAAATRLAAAKAALTKAVEQKDKEAILRAKELMDSAGGYYDQLEDPSAAVSGLQKVTQAMIEARKAQEVVELAENQKKYQKEVDQNAEKIEKINRDEETALAAAKDRLKLKMDAINSYYVDAEAREARRHTIEIGNIEAEIAKLREKAAAVTAKQDEVLKTAPPTGGSTQSSGSRLDDPSFDMKKYERDVGIATSNGVQTGVKEGAVAGAAEASNSITQAVGSSVAAGTEDIFKDVKVEGMPLDQWIAMGKKGGAATAAAAQEEIKNFHILKDVEGQPVSVVINPATKEEVEPLLASIKKALAEYPGEPTLDFDEAEKMLREFVKNAQAKYKVTLSVSTTQNKADGGQVYGMAGGGKIPGTKSPKDKVNVKSRPGEWFINDEPATYWSKSIGSWFMNAVHKPMSQAGQYLKDSVLKGPKSRAVPIPVPVKNNDSDVLSSIKSFGMLSSNLQGSINKLTESIGVQAPPESYNIVLNYSGPASAASSRNMAKGIVSELRSMNRSKS